MPMDSECPRSASTPARTTPVESVGRHRSDADNRAAEAPQAGETAPSMNSRPPSESARLLAQSKEWKKARPPSSRTPSS